MVGGCEYDRPFMCAKTNGVTESHRRAELQRSFNSRSATTATPQADAAHAFIWIAKRCSLRCPDQVASAIGQCQPFSTAHPKPPVRFPPRAVIHWRSANGRSRPMSVVRARGGVSRKRSFPAGSHRPAYARVTRVITAQNNDANGAGCKSMDRGWFRYCGG